MSYSIRLGGPVPVRVRNGLFTLASTTALYVGSLFPIGAHVEFNPYYEHENNTGGHKNHPENAVGLALYLFFSLDSK